MNAQEYWKYLYQMRHSLNYAWYLSKRRETRREAALERICARQQREIEAQENKILELNKESEYWYEAYCSYVEKN